MASARPASADLPAGALVAGFRVEGVIGRGPRATVYAARQLSLGRPVALKIVHDAALMDRVRRLRWPEHPGAVSLYGVGDSEHGPWLAMRLVSGGTLERRRASLDLAAGALEAAHAEGIVHGAVAARNVLVEDGRGYLSDFGLGDPSATAEDDRAAFEELVRTRSSRRRRTWIAAAGVVAALLAVVLVGAAIVADDGPGTASAPAPPAPEGTSSIGSGLAPGGVASVDCMGRTPDGASRSCTISQRDLAGKPVVAAAGGTITRWAVRGASGTLALQVLRGSDGGLIQVAKSPDETISDTGLHVASASLPIATGDRIALEVTPGSAIGVRREGPEATVDRWFGPLLEPARPPESPPGTGLDEELLLRVDIRPAPQG